MVTAAPASAVLTESATLVPRTAAEPKGIWRSRLIEADVQGSSGYYPAEVLLRDGPNAFPAGTHVYFDHPTPSEEDERPERSVKDIAGYLLDTAQFEDGPDGRGLFARIQFTEAAKKHIIDVAPVIGLSIRATGEIENTAQGRIVRSIRDGLSVDLVTRPGAGGRLVVMTESATPETPTPGTTAPSTSPIIPSTTGTGALLSEVASMKDTFKDALEQLQVEVARLSQQVKESQRELANQARENKNLAEAITFLRENAEATTQKMNESKKTGDVLVDLLEAKLPIPSMIRIAQSHRPDKDLHEEIQQERDYLKKLRIETERSSMSESNSNLGLNESAASLFSAATSASSANEADINEVADVLSGRMF